MPPRDQAGDGDGGHGDAAVDGLGPWGEADAPVAPDAHGAILGPDLLLGAEGDQVVDYAEGDGAAV
eukprot:scaffold1397_cov122-Isochrysis_galbana.AAC.1